MATIAVKERPILFSGPMVRAILDGKKTQTRRIISKNNSTACGHRRLYDHLLWDRGVHPDRGYSKDGWEYLHVAAWNPADGPSPKNDKDLLWYRVRSAREPGTMLWVRESFCLLDQDHWWDYRKPKDFKYSIGRGYRANGCAYRAETDSDGDDIRKGYGYKWTPSIHMPRWASRLTLEITSVRVQRVQEISEDDAQAEGVEWNNTPMRFGHTCAKSAYAALWDEINGAGSWESSPWVWALTFKVL